MTSTNLDFRKMPERLLKMEPEQDALQVVVCYVPYLCERAWGVLREIGPKQVNLMCIGLNSGVVADVAGEAKRMLFAKSLWSENMYDLAFRNPLSEDLERCLYSEPISDLDRLVCYAEIVHRVAA